MSAYTLSYFRRWALAVGLILGMGVPLVQAQELQAPTPDIRDEVYDTRDPGAWVLSGWKVVISSSDTGNQGAWVEVRARSGFTTDIQTREGSQKARQEGGKIVEFRVPNEDIVVDVKVTDPRGSTWTGSVDVARNQRVTVGVDALYDHRGYTGIVKNDTERCRSSQRKTLRFEVLQNGVSVKPAFDLDTGKSLPMLRLMRGDYVMRISEKRGANWEERAARPFQSTVGWRFDEGCK